MDRLQQLEFINQIVHPKAEDASIILQQLHLSPPTREEIHKDIERRLLLPPTTFPQQWLPSYQVLADSHLVVFNS
jgi:antiviral helicase SKI2